MKMVEFDHPFMVWSMYDTDPVDRLDDLPDTPENRVHWNKAYDQMELNLDAPEGLADGTYRFSFESFGQSKLYNGVILVDGKFSPVATAHAVYLGLLDHHNILSGEVHHCFIERIEYQPATDTFKIGLGS